MVCEHCKGVDHEGQPAKCRGGTWCDCLHRRVIEITSQVESQIVNDTQSESVVN